MRILAGYASAHGSTAVNTHRIADVLRPHGWAVDAVAIQEIVDPSVYVALVLGGAIHNHAWLPVATEFFHRHQGVLRARPVWLFSEGLSAGLPRPLRRPGRAARKRRIAEALRDVVRPRGHRLFSGVARPEQFPPWSGVLVRTMGGHFGDYQDGGAVEAWARDNAWEPAAHSSAALNSS